MARLYQSFIGGEISDNPLTSGATTLNSAALAAMQAVASPDTMVICLDPDGINGAPEYVTVTAHTASATTATIVRGAMGTTAREHRQGLEWVHPITHQDIVLPFKRLTYTGGDITLNNTSWTTLSATEVVLSNVEAGDMIEATLSVLSGNQAVHSYLDVATWVSSAIVNRFSGGSDGVQAWRGFASSFSFSGGSVMYPLVSGDIVSGSVTLRLAYKTDVASNRTLSANTTTPLNFSVKVLGRAQS